MWSRQLGQDHHYAANHLANDERRRHVESRQRLEKNEAESNALDGVQNPQPQPDHPREHGTNQRTVGKDRNIKRDTRSAPQSLTPSRGAKRDGEYWYQPWMGGRLPGENQKHGGPDTDKEQEN